MSWYDPTSWDWSGAGNAVSNYLFGDDKVSVSPADLKLGHGDYSSNYIQGMLGGVNQRQAPQAGNTMLGPAAQLNQNQYNQWRQQQMGLAGQLNDVATGQQAGAGELAVQRQMQNALAAQASAANSARGANAMLGARAAVRGAGDLGVNAAGMSQQAALQDQTAARGLLAGVLGQGAQQYIGIAGQNAQLSQQQMLQQGAMNQQTALANMQAKLQQMGMNDQASLAYLSALTGIDQSELQARLGNASLQASQRNPGQFGALLGAAGGLMTGAGALGLFGSGGAGGGGGGGGGAGMGNPSPYGPNGGYWG